MAEEIKKSEKRQALKDLTYRLVQNARNSGATDIQENKLLLIYYSNITRASQFFTFETWLEKGYQVRKGEKGYPAWGMHVEKVSPEGNTYSYKPVINWFTEKQVIKKRPL